jgi:predicted metal-binding membrane protein
LRVATADGGVVSTDRAFVATCTCAFVVFAAATIAWCGSMDGGMAMPGGWTMSMAWMRMPGQTWADAAATFMGMWIVMMVAMMLPSLVPMLVRWRRGPTAPDEALGACTLVAVAGYFLVWTLVGAGAYPVGVAIGAATMRWDAVARAVPLATGVALVLAGWFQQTAWKRAQLAACLHDSACAAPPARQSAWRDGVRMGIACARCCAGWMAVLLVTGVLDVGAMTAVAAGITAERWSARADVARATGLLVTALGIVAIVRAL